MVRDKALRLRSQDSNGSLDASTGSQLDSVHDEKPLDVPLEYSAAPSFPLNANKEVVAALRLTLVLRLAGLTDKYGSAGPFLEAAV